MRVVVLSSTAFGHRCVAEGVVGVPGVELVGLLTTAPAISISYSPGRPVRLSTHASFADLAAAGGFELVDLGAKVEPRAYDAPLERLAPDLLLALGWYYMVPRRVRARAPRGCLGIHASLLPRFRGGAPLNWAIIEGERETGVTLFHLEDGVDDGDVVAQGTVTIGDDDTIATVYERATRASIELLRRELPRLADGTATRTPQDHSKATSYPQRSPEDGRIDWSWSPRRIRDFIRAQTRPYPGAWTVIDGRKVILWDAEVAEPEGGSPETR